MRAELTRVLVLEDEEQKAAMKAIILHRFAAYDVNRLPIDLRSFYQSIR